MRVNEEKEIINLLKNKGLKFKRMGDTIDLYIPFVEIPLTRDEYKKIEKYFG